jgi:hypothetical protein
MSPNVRLLTVVEPEKKLPSAPRKALMAKKPWTHTGRMVC